MKKIIIIGVIIALFGGAVYVVNNYKLNLPSTSGNQAASNGNISSNENNINKFINIKTKGTLPKAIDFKLKDLDGNTVSLSDLKGKNVYINFWASWCPPCRGEMPDIEKLYQETKNSDLVIIAVNLGEDKDTVKNFIKINNYHFKVLLDSDESVAGKYNISAIPDSYFIDKDGNINSYKIGAMTIDEMRSRVSQLDK